MSTGKNLSDHHNSLSAGKSRIGDRTHPIDAEEMFAGRKEVVISFNKIEYVLRITRYGKLILNK